jgi:HEAT repeat protein
MSIEDTPTDGERAGELSFRAFLLMGRAKGTALRRLRSLLAHPSAEVRDSAAQSLGSVGDRSSLADLIVLLDAGPPRDTTGTAWAVAEIGCLHEDTLSEARGALERYRTRARGFTRRHADALLTKLDTPTHSPRARDIQRR